MWDYCSASASLFIGTSTVGYTAGRILDATDASINGLFRTPISALFHGYLNSDRIEAALEQLVSLGAIQQSSQPSAGPPSTLWSTTAEAQSMGGEETAYQSTTEYATKEDSTQEQT